jgi:hypothetical protein
VRSLRLQIPVTAAEKKMLVAAARREGRPLADWLRELGKAAAKESEHGN